MTKANDYDCLIVKDKFFAVFFAERIAKRLGVPYVYWLSFPFPESSAYKAGTKRGFAAWFERLRGRFMHWVLYSRVPRSAAHIFVQSEWMKADLVEKGVPRHLMTAVPMGVATELLPAEDTPPARKEAIYIGTLNRARRLDFLINAFATVVKDIPDARLHIVGSAHNFEDEQALHKLVHDLGLTEAIRFTGFSPPEDVARFCQRIALRRVAHSADARVLAVVAHQARGIHGPESCRTGQRHPRSGICHQRERRRYLRTFHRNRIRFGDGNTFCRTGSHASAWPERSSLGGSAPLLRGAWCPRGRNLTSRPRSAVLVQQDRRCRRHAIAALATGH